MLEIKNISSGYGKKQVLYNVSLHVKKGEVVLLTGGNGSGKSTLLKCIYNLLPCWSGEIFFKGEKINSLIPSDLISKGIVYIPQKDFYFENLTVEENLQISGNILPKTELKERIAEVYELTGLTKFRKRKPFDLSGGERKILAFCMGLIHNPKFLLFDEPFAGVDAKNTATLLKLFKETIINTENSIIIVEHKDDAKQLFTRKINMELGIIKSN
ncbi:MAG: ATP-binding cassette domain-containing protein [Bacteroidales bacterium]|nr:ATP-binding cassette domain-containing protein [Bacteroidales bacterium]